mgnify:FL=1
MLELSDYEMKIKQIEIENFRCYRNVELRFADRVTILIGKNGSGKTSFLKSIKNVLSVFFSNNPSWGCGTIVGNVSDLLVSNLNSGEVWHDENMKPADFVDIKAFAFKTDNEGNAVEEIPSWSFRKFSTANAKVQSSYYKDAYVYFRTRYTDDAPWPLFAYYSDSYPHIDANLGKKVSGIIDNDEKLYRAWGYYHWDKDSSCTLIWQKRFMRIAKLRDNMRNMLERVSDKKTAEAESYQRNLDRYEAEMEFVLKYLRKFTSDATENLSDRSNALQVGNVIVDGIDNPYLVAYFADGSRRKWSELPAGYERLFNIVFDIAYRSYILNGCDCEPKGVVIIDEIDLHLHPSMEQDVLLRLVSTFEQVQFIVSTHSPLVIGNTALGEHGRIILMQEEQGRYEQMTLSNDVFGIDYDYILSAVMQTEPRNVKLERLQDRYVRLMRNDEPELAGESLEEMKNLLSPERFSEIMQKLEQRLKG